MMTIRIIIILAIISITLSQLIYPYYCKRRDRRRICTEEYIGVCGWFSRNIRCFIYPCAITAGNICQACVNKDVKYVTLGECPLAG